MTCTGRSRKLEVNLNWDFLKLDFSRSPRISGVDFLNWLFSKLGGFEKFQDISEGRFFNWVFFFWTLAKPPFEQNLKKVQKLDFKTKTVKKPSI